MSGGRVGQAGSEDKHCRGGKVEVNHLAGIENTLPEV